MFETNYSEKPFKFELMPIELRSVSFQKSSNNLIDNISLSINSKGITIILGPNGAGKSILMRLLHGLEKPKTQRSQSIITMAVTRQTITEEYCLSITERFTACIGATVTTPNGGVWATCAAATWDKAQRSVTHMSVT